MGSRKQLPAIWLPQTKILKNLVHEGAKTRTNISPEADLIQLTYTTLTVATNEVVKHVRVEPSNRPIPDVGVCDLGAESLV